jgi:ABC-type branched-subunit amino acid transport system substrate-binding protein
MPLNPIHHGNLILSAIILVVLVSACGITSADDSPVYIGVLLPLTGPEGLPLLDALQLAINQINDGGGIGGRPVELVLRDTRTGDLMTYARDLAQDPRIDVVIGPCTSDQLFQVSPLFVRNQKVLITPTASSDEIYRAYAGTGSVWRTIANEGDIASVVLQQIRANGGKKVALLTVNSTNGKTFYDWIPYWAIENGVTITGAEEYSGKDEIPGAIRRISRQNPDYLIFVHSGSGSEIRSAIAALNEINASSHMYLIYPHVDENGLIWERPDSEALQVLLDSRTWKLYNVSTISTTLPDQTLILMSKPWDPEFSAEFHTISKTEKPDFAPEVYDALLVGAEIVARCSAYPNKSPMNASITIFSNVSGEAVPRTKEGFQLAFNQILNGGSPVLTGATGPLTFLPEGTDRLIPWYETYRMDEGKIIEDPVPYQKQSKSDSLSVQDPSSGSPVPVAQKLPSDNFWAVIGAFSRDWVNYRHQADALTVYRFLKYQGVPDDHIILLVNDDITEDKRNTKPGEVFHIPGTEEVRKQADPDFTGDQVNRGMLMDLLSGTGTNQDKAFLQSDENSTVLVYLSSHGGPGGDLIMGNGSERVSAQEFSSLIDKMAEEKKFKRMLVVLESCFSGAIAANVTTPGVVVMSAASPDETSKSAIFDSELSNWLSDEFTAQFISLIRTSDPSLTLGQLYQQLFYHVRSSHPGISKGNASLDIPAYVFFGRRYDE